MPARHTKFDFDPAEKMRRVNAIIAFFRDERGEEIGIVAAEAMLDFFVRILGEDFYRRGVKDCRKLLKEKCEDLEVELDMLEPNR